jgi:hypothetical protein
MEPQISLICYQESSTCPYPEPHQSNTYHTIVSKIHFNINRSSTSMSSWWSPSFWLLTNNPYIFSSHHSCYIPCRSHPPFIYHSNYAWRRVQFSELLIMRFLPSCYFVPLKSKYSSQHPVLKHP